MTMKGCSVEEQDKAGTPVKFVPVQMLEQRMTEIHNIIARRAYELFEYRGCLPSHEIDDWVQAESELVYPCCHDLKESEEAIILHIDLPGSITADQLTVSVEPRRLLVSSEKEISSLYGGRYSLGGAIAADLPSPRPTGGCGPVQSNGDTWGPCG